jgi:putative addiction module antidote
MELEFRIVTIGHELGIVLPTDVVTRLGVKAGESIEGIETPAGLELRAPNPEFVEQMDIARRVMKRYEGALHKLADC